MKDNAWKQPKYDSSKAEAELREAIAKAEQRELIVLKLKEDLVPKNAAKIWLIALGTAAKMAFQGLPKRLAPIVVLLNDVKEIETIIRNEIYQIIRELEKPLDAKSSRSKKRDS